MSTSTPVHVIVAATPEGGIGLRGGLPWHLPAEVAHFRRVTSAAPQRAVNAVVVGRRTWASIPANADGVRLPGRMTAVVTSRPPANVVGAPSVVAPTLAGAVDELQRLAARDEVRLHAVFVAGGAALYAEALTLPQLHTLHLTRVHRPAGAEPCDVLVPAVAAAALDEGAFALARVGPRVVEPDGTQHQALTYEARRVAGARSPEPSPAYQRRVAHAVATGRHEEHQYLALLRDVIGTGELAGDRTGVGTRAKFGATLRFSLRGGALPLFTTKRVWWKGVLEELLWFLRGSTDAAALAARGVGIWDANASRAFLDGRGLARYRQGDLGPTYGHQWRHAGAPYAGADADYAGQGVDQVAGVLRALRAAAAAVAAGEPLVRDRRLLLSAWNVPALPEMALPPCHVLAQFLVTAPAAGAARAGLTTVVYQRSADLGLGVPFNVASYAALTALLAHLAGLEPAEVVHTSGDAHVYASHVEPLLEQLGREPRPFPTLTIDPALTRLDDAEPRHFVVAGYDPWPAVSMPMAV
jgi:dihydrofolate reductase/thymidylate synthase